jgi:hypothetical protein
VLLEKKKSNYFLVKLRFDLKIVCFKKHSPYLQFEN